MKLAAVRWVNLAAAIMTGGMACVPPVTYGNVLAAFAAGFSFAAFISLRTHDKMSEANNKLMETLAMALEANHKMGKFIQDTTFVEIDEKPEDGQQTMH